MDQVKLYMLLGAGALVFLNMLLRAIARARYVGMMRPEVLTNLTEEEVLVGRQSFIGYLVLRLIGTAGLLGLLLVPQSRQAPFLVPVIVGTLVFMAASVWMAHSAKPVVEEIVAIKRAERAASWGEPPDDVARSS